MEFKHTHSSGKYNAPAAELHKAVQSYAETASIITFTEVDREVREKALKLRGFGVLATDHGAKDDSAIVYNGAEWQKIYHRPHLVGSHLFKLGGHLSSPLWAQVAVLEHKQTKKRVVVGVCHFPSGVEGDLAHHRKTDRIAAWRQSTNNLRKHLNAVKRHYHADAIILSGDWNINFKHTWARALIKANFPIWNLVWSRAGLPSRGTHGARLIDGAVLRGLRVLQAFVEKDDPSSDHTPWSEVLTFK